MTAGASSPPAEPGRNMTRLPTLSCCQCRLSEAASSLSQSSTLQGRPGVSSCLAHKVCTSAPDQHAGSCQGNDSLVLVLGWPRDRRQLPKEFPEWARLQVRQGIGSELHHDCLGGVVALSDGGEGSSSRAQQTTLPRHRLPCMAVTAVSHPAQVPWQAVGPTDSSMPQSPACKGSEHRGSTFRVAEDRPSASLRHPCRAVGGPATPAAYVPACAVSAVLSSSTAGGHQSEGRTTTCTGCKRGGPAQSCDR